MLKKYGDIISGGLFLLLSVAIYIGSAKVKTLSVSSIGSGFFPMIVSVLMGILSLVVIYGGIRKAMKAEAAEKAAGAGSEETPTEAAAKAEADDQSKMWPVVATFALMAGYAALMPRLGFLITTALYLYLQMNIMGWQVKRKQLVFAIVSLVASPVIYFAFVKIFSLMLPAGILG